MKKIWFLIISSSLLLSGCLNITDELFLEKDGSGKYVTTINMEKLQEIMDMAKSYAPDSMQNNDLTAVMHDSLQTMIKDLSSIPGITEVKNDNPNKSTVVISFRFKDVNALNAALRKRTGKPSNVDYFSYSKGVFSCNDQSLTGMGDLMKELDNAKDTSAMSDMPKMNSEEMKGMMKMLNLNMTMKTIYHFPQKVTSFSNKSAKLSEDGKTLTLEVDLLDDSQQKTLENKINFQ